MARADRVPFAFVWPVVAVRATVNDLDVFLVVDTGAQQTVMSRKVAARLSLDLDRPLRLQPLIGVGRSPPVPMVRLERPRVGASTVTGLDVFLYDLPPFFRADGLLGLDFLRRFRVTFAFDSRVLILREPPPR